MIEKEAQELLKKYRLGTLTDQERALLESWYIQYARSNSNIDISQEELQEDLDNIYNALPIHKKAVRNLFAPRSIRFSLYAASVVLFMIAGMLFLKNKQRHVPKLASAYQTTIAPGKSSAVLTLADNRKIVLDNNFSGAIAHENGITVSKTTAGLLRYTVNEKQASNDATVAYNTISTPVGGEYQVVLADGTEVWLNALSSIRFPTSFKGSERKVEITGEAYFEVAKNAQMPFRVVSGYQVVEVLGTHFNISAYPDESAVATTLLEGSVKVAMNDGQVKVLKPGQQALILKKNNSFTVKDVDAEDAVAWKNGYFQFADDDLKSIMNQLSRWYNVEIVYQHANLDQKFGGTISRSKNLSQVLRILELTGNVRFRVEGRRVTVMP
ncbi:FecR family protein [Mucilaginibacter arboris]|uniref:DUF4974 domain-containing protein n=1 Tax=Mucilaginibacter arboris TaxID=2682090 RepID=A0A7K1ST49_9SPHI|nr:FecR domain-containing protein [Mucilaginibacter arboris]MVN20482.1 DUF4974 domain-containing protein [Mucilaginibacter arboris]